MKLRHDTFAGPARIIGIKSLDYYLAQEGHEYPWHLVREGPTAKRSG